MYGGEIMTKDQWKSNGDCLLCRRKDYCKTNCKAHKENIEKIIKQSLVNKLGVDKYYD